MRSLGMRALCMLLPAAFAIGVMVVSQPVCAIPPSSHDDDAGIAVGSRRLSTLIREFSKHQEDGVSGRGDKVSTQVSLAREINEQLNAMSAAAWAKPQHRMELVKYTLMSGETDRLERWLIEGKFPEDEVSLARGALDYGRGLTTAAAAHLDSVRPRMLGPSLAGHSALIKAIAYRDADPAAARGWCDEARLLSPGTAIEEAALRLALELAIVQGDGPGFDVNVLRYAYRFSHSVYRPKLDARVARILAARRPGDNAVGLAKTLAAQLSAIERSAFFAELAQAALRAGNVATAAHAAQAALDESGTTGERTALLRAIEGAALIVGHSSEEGLRVLAEAEKSMPSPAVRELIVAARRLLAMIVAPPDAIKTGFPGYTREPISTDREASKEDEHNRAIAIVTQKLSDIDALMERVGP